MSITFVKTVELTGSSETGIQDAIQTAISKASETIRNIRWFHVTETRGHVAEGVVAYWQVTLKVGFGRPMPARQVIEAVAAGLSIDAQ